MLKAIAAWVDLVCLIVGVVFIVLKATGNVDWSWAWVLAPFWLPVTVVIAGLILAKLLTHPR